MNHALPLPGRTPLDALPDDGFLRQKTLISTGITPFSSTTLWRKVNAGEFPRPIKLSTQITAWRVSDVKVWARDPAGYNAELQPGAK